MSTVEPVLRLGSQHLAVIRLQDLLQNAGALPRNAARTNVLTREISEAVHTFQASRLGPDGSPLDIDGIVGPDTWWALKHPSGETQRSHLQPLALPAGIMGERAALLKILIAEHGAHEEPNGSNGGPQIEKFFPPWARNKRLPWCAFFWSWGVREATGRLPYGTWQGSCRRIFQLAREHDQIVTDYRDYCPGDALLFADAAGVPHHISTLATVSDDGTRGNTIGGNEANRVKAGLRELRTAACAVRLWPAQDFERGLWPQVKPNAGDTTR